MHVKIESITSTTWLISPNTHKDSIVGEAALYIVVFGPTNYNFGFEYYGSLISGRSQGKTRENTCYGY